MKSAKKRQENESKGFNFVIACDGTIESLRGLTLAKQLVKNLQDKVYTLSVIEKDGNLNEVAEKLSVEAVKINLKVEVIVKEKNAEEMLCEKLLMELQDSQSLKFDFMLISRNSFLEMEISDGSLATVPEFLIRRFEGNIVIY